MTTPRVLRDPIGLAGLTRTPMGRPGGGLAAWQPYELLAHVLRESASRTTGSVDEVIAGSIRSHIGNVGRVGALAAGLDVAIPAITVDRQCASSLEALAVAAAKIGSGLASHVLLGGVESASRGPWFYDKTPRPFAWAEPQPYVPRMSSPEIGDPAMGETAELLADEFQISREEMDAFALRSHQRAARAAADGVFDGEIVPLPARGRAPEVTADETVRGDTSPEQLAGLRPVFRRDGRVTAGNSSPLTDGATACYAAGLETFAADGRAPDAVLTALHTVALDPNRMGMGPAVAIPPLLEVCGLQADDIDLFEINEAFAAQALACNRELQLPEDKLNVCGGAIALGHAFGATGIRLVATLVSALRARGGRLGVVSLCVGGGQGMAALIELP